MDMKQGGTEFISLHRRCLFNGPSASGDGVL